MDDAPHDPIVEAVRADLLRRSQVGLAKYGVALDRKDLTLRDWLQHAYEETLDQANYLKRAIVEIDAQQAARRRAMLASDLLWEPGFGDLLRLIGGVFRRRRGQ
jgi:hypothetical protein